MKRPELGSWHTITERAEKFKDGFRVNWHSEPIEDLDARRGELTFTGEGEPTKKSWFDDNWNWKPAPPIASYRAMYIGYRHKQNGHWESGGGWDDGGIENYFKPSESVEIWLFVTHENRNPILVFPFEVKQK